MPAPVLLEKTHKGPNFAGGGGFTRPWPLPPAPFNLDNSPALGGTGALPVSGEGQRPARPSLYTTEGGGQGARPGRSVSGPGCYPRHVGLRTFLLVCSADHCVAEKWLCILTCSLVLPQCHPHRTECVKVGRRRLASVQLEEDCPSFNPGPNASKAQPQTLLDARRLDVKKC